MTRQARSLGVTDGAATLAGVADKLLAAFRGEESVLYHHRPS